MINPYQLLSLHIAVQQKGQSCDIEATTVNTVNTSACTVVANEDFMHLILKSKPAALVKPAFCIQSVLLNASVCAVSLVTPNQNK